MFLERITLGSLSKEGKSSKERGQLESDPENVTQGNT
jgi:hypothetical protein